MDNRIRVAVAGVAVVLAVSAGGALSGAALPGAVPGALPSDALPGDGRPGGATMITFEPADERGAARVGGAVERFWSVARPGSVPGAHGVTWRVELDADGSGDP